MAHNVSRYARLKWIMETSLTKTLAAKLRISVHQVYQRYGAMLYTNGVPYKGLRVTVEREGKPPLVAEWGGIPLKRHVTAPLVDQPKPVWNTRTDLEQRLLANTCELCGAQEHIEVHQIRALKRLQASGRSPKPRWVQTMAARQRKTLVVCRTCHGDIQHGHPPRRVGRR
jgi:Type II intron maturase